ncbi:RHS repeat domain-containing protein [Chitinophagaceae bacterium MMS25-I14]
MTLERETLHIADDSGRVSMIETRTQYTDDSLPQLQRFIYSNHLGSAALELDETAEVISYEEYHPYGTTAYQAMNRDITAIAKRYRYTGKERDEESGLYYHGARYYIPWLCRWSAVDPLESKYAPLSSYNYGFDNPITWTDPTGKGPGPATLPKPPAAPPEEPIENGRPNRPPVSPDVKNDYQLHPDEIDPRGGGSVYVPAPSVGRGYYMDVNNNNGSGYGDAAFAILAEMMKEKGKPLSHAQILEITKKLSSVPKGSGGPFISKDAEHAYIAYQCITTGQNNLTAQDIADSKSRLAQGKGNLLDHLYAAWGMLDSQNKNASQKSASQDGNKPKVIVIGEVQADVEKFAKTIGAETIMKDWPKAINFRRYVPDKHEAISLGFNRKWINEKMDAGYMIYDIGSKGDQPNSKFYKMEIEEINKRDYKNYFNLKEAGYYERH